MPTIYCDTTMLARLTEAKAGPNLESVLQGLSAYGNKAGLNPPHRLAQYLAQVSHESMSFVYDREVWGPTPAQKRYDTRTDLGNTPAVDGDGFEFRGRTAMQITGRANTASFWKWCVEAGLNPPDFRKQPDLMNTDPWEGLGPIWYWVTRNLNTWADYGDTETITKKINGGYNGLSDRLRRYDRIGLSMMGFQHGDVKGFQAKHNLVVDGIVGPKTRSRIHDRLCLLPDFEFPSTSLTGRDEQAPSSMLSRLFFGLFEKWSSR